jgi:hypothetical protein
VPASGKIAIDDRTDEIGNGRCCVAAHELIVSVL